MSLSCKTIWVLSKYITILVCGLLVDGTLPNDSKLIIFTDLAKIAH